MTLPTSSSRKKYYQRTLKSHGESPKSLQWVNYRAAALRYHALVSSLTIEGKSILDAGCGMGDLLPYLYADTGNFQYLGVDVTPEFIDIANKRYDGDKFQVANPFSSEFNEKFDIVLSSGVMNSVGEDWLEQRKTMITKLYSLSNNICAFNMAGGFEPNTSTKTIAYANCLDILKHCKSLTSEIVLINNYHPKDFTVLLYKQPVGVKA
ncbi:class I SAM-dependent methyltransferase [Candidatus Saccharibacteria bacterium]|nr:class I SAM-dependent methyltransferase [Candidatus Saccharibacteria bacterium]